MYITAPYGPYTLDSRPHRIAFYLFADLLLLLVTDGMIPGNRGRMQLAAVFSYTSTKSRRPEIKPVPVFEDMLSAVKV
jgi:hypothetical protein